MPRKQNGLGNTGSFSKKPNNKNRIDRSQKKGAAGYYPSNRQYGSSVHRSVIEQYNLDSDWVKWRKGYEYYMKAPWNDIKEYDEYTQTYSEWSLLSILYQGVGFLSNTQGSTSQQKIIPLDIAIKFSGKIFPGKGDNASHYVVKRENVNTENLGTIKEVTNYGSSDILKVIPTKLSIDNECRLIPFIKGKYIISFSVNENLLIVDWGKDY